MWALSAARGGNAFLYYFRPVCAGWPAAQQASPTLSCEQREQVHRVHPWALRTYYYGAAARADNNTYDAQWYGAQRAEGARLVRNYLRLQPHVRSRLHNLSLAYLGRASAREAEGASRAPVLGVHLRGTDKGKYL